MPALHDYRLFISHAWTYGGAYDRMISFLDNANNFKYSNYSVPVNKAFEGMSKLS